MELNVIKKLFTELRDNLELQHDSSLVYCEKAIRDIIAVLESDESEQFKTKSVVKAFGRLYTGRGRLQEYHICDDDSEEQIKLDEPFTRIKNELWKIVGPYVMNLDVLKKLFTELRDYLELQHDRSMFYYERIIRNIVAVLESDESVKFKIEYVIDAFPALYSCRGGLSEYYIWDNDYEKRMKLNEPFRRIQKGICAIVGPYIV